MSRGMGAMQAEIIETIKTWRDQEYLSWVTIR